MSHCPCCGQVLPPSDNIRIDPRTGRLHIGMVSFRLQPQLGHFLEELIAAGDKPVTFARMQYVLWGHSAGPEDPRTVLSVYRYRARQMLRGHGHDIVVNGRGERRSMTLVRTTLAETPVPNPVTGTTTGAHHG